MKLAGSDLLFTRSPLFLSSTASIIAGTLLTLCGGTLPGCSGETSPKLKFYVVHLESANGLRYFDEAPYRQLGYIPLRPDLVVSELEEVSIEKSRRDMVIVQQDGTIEKDAFDNTGVLIRFSRRETAAIDALTRDNVGKRLLVVLGTRPIFAPIVQSRIDTGVLVITPPKEVDVHRLKERLQTLLRDRPPIK